MKVNRRAFTILTIAASGAAGLAILPAQAQQFDVEVDPAQSKFSPESITIKSGDTITWTNTQIVTHTVTFDPAQSKKAGNVALPAGVQPFDSGDMGQDKTFAHQFTTAGTYKYICKYHEDMGMIGTVIVT